MFVLSLARVLVIRFHETPKFLLCQGKDEEVIKTLRNLAVKYDRAFHLTLEQLQACGQINSAHAQNKASLSEVAIHIKGLFATRTMALSTSLVWLSWAMIGLGYALYYVYLPEYLASRDAATGESSDYITWRNYAITNLCAVPGPIIAGFMCEMPMFGRKRTMAFGAFATSKLYATRNKNYLSNCTKWPFSLVTPPFARVPKIWAFHVRSRSLLIYTMRHCTLILSKYYLLRIVELEMVWPLP